MKITDYEISFAYGEGDTPEHREIGRNIRTILQTPVGTCPLYRDFGVNFNVLDKPLEAAKNLLSVEIMKAVERYEPRVQVREVTFRTAAANGSLQVKVVVA